MSRSEPQPPTDGPLTPDGFVQRFKASSRKLWVLAAGILGDRALAEDVLQDAAMTALGRLESFVPGTSFEAWVGQIVRYTALNQARRHYRGREIGGDDHLRAAEEAGARPTVVDPFGQLDPTQEHFDDALTRALAELGEMPRASFLLRTLMGLSYREISELLGIPEGTAMSHVHRSRANLRTLLEADVSFELCTNWRAS